MARFGYVYCMDRGRKILLIMAALVGLVVVATATLSGLWAWSPRFQERVYEAMLFSGLSPWEKRAAERLIDYPSRDSAIALLVYVNHAPKNRANKEEAARRALLSLCLMTGQEFGTGFRMYGQRYDWDPPSGDYAWGRVMAEANPWAVNAFGFEALSALHLGDDLKEIKEKAP